MTTAVVFNKIEEVILSDIVYTDDGLLFWKSSGSGRKLNKPLGSKTHQGYFQTTICGRQVKVHHVVWFIHKGVWPKSLDHIDKDKGNNKISNLREGVSINNHNRVMPLPKSKLSGAYYRKNREKWFSSIKLNKKIIGLGSFNCPGAAHMSYMRAKESILNE